MNTHQKKYALQRIDGLQIIKIREAEEKFTTKAVTLNNDEKYKLIANGSVKILPFNRIGNYSPDLYPSFDFSAHESKAKLDDKKYNPIVEKINSISQQAKDQIMLGDCEEAMRLIQQLENMKV